jgi:hypothetical protein
MEQRIQLSTTESVTSNYAGEAANRFYSAVLKSPTSIANGGVSFIDGIQYKWNIPRLNLSGLVANATCDFNDVGTVTRTERVLTLEDFEVNLKLCKAHYRPTFDKMGGSRYNGLATGFANALVDLTAANVAESRENVMWSGVTATAGMFDGFETIMTNEPLQPAAYEIAGTTLSAANIVAQLGLIRTAADSALYDKDSFAIRIPTSARKFYISAMAALGYMDKFYDGRAPLNFEGIPLIHCSGMSDDVMMATYADNLYYGVGSAGDSQRVSVLDQQNVDGSDNVHVIMKWGDGAQIANPEDLITYGITNSGN